MRSNRMPQGRVNPLLNSWGVDRPPQAYLMAPNNMMAADQAMGGLTQQERNLYDRHLMNLWGPGGVDNIDGSRSTLLQATITGPDNRAYAIPTVWNGQIIHNRDALVRNIRDAGGLSQFPSYATPEDAEARYGLMHGFIDRDMAPYWNQRRWAPGGWRE